MPDLAAGRAALEELRRAAQNTHVLIDPDDAARRARRVQAAAETQARSHREEQLTELHRTFLDLHRENDRQARGYGFERLLTGLFRTTELDYGGSYKTDVDQVDGYLILDSFTYLIEARWRTALAAAADICGLASKVERRLDATRGLLLSMAGFRPEVVDLYRLARDNRLVLFDGQDLMCVLEQRVGLVEGLQEKVRAASTRGEPFLPLVSLC